jgi:hypothetical protein
MMDSYSIFKRFKKRKTIQAWWHLPLGRLRQKDDKFKAKLGYILRPHLKKTKH